MVMNQPDLPDPTQLIAEESVGRRAVTLMDQSLDTVLERLDRGYAPIFESHNEAGRTILTLSSGALVLSISLVQFLAEEMPTPSAAWLLPAAWILLTISAAAEVYRLGRLAPVRSYRLSIELQRGEMRLRLLGIGPDEDADAIFDQVVTAAFKKVDDDQRGWLRSYTRFLYISGASFILGLVALLIFAVLNFPFG